MTFTGLEPLMADVIVDEPLISMSLLMHPIILAPLAFITTLILASAILAYRHKHDENKTKKAVLVTSLIIATAATTIITITATTYWHTPKNDTIYQAMGVDNYKPFLYHDGQWYGYLAKSDTYAITWPVKIENVPDYIRQNPTQYEKKSLEPDMVLQTRSSAPPTNDPWLENDPFY